MGSPQNNLRMLALKFLSLLLFISAMLHAAKHPMKRSVNFVPPKAQDFTAFVQPKQVYRSGSEEPIVSPIKSPLDISLRFVPSNAQDSTAFVQPKQVYRSGFGKIVVIGGYD